VKLAFSFKMAIGIACFATAGAHSEAGMPSDIPMQCMEVSDQPTRPQNTLARAFCTQRVQGRGTSQLTHMTAVASVNWKPILYRSGTKH
jgi:hypothetical protein